MFPRTECHLTGQCTASMGTAFQLNSLLFVNDGAFLFQNRADIEEESQIIHTHFAHFSLQMHVGTKDSKSKMEAMFFPPSLYL